MNFISLSNFLFFFGLLGLCRTQLGIWRFRAFPNPQHLAFDGMFIVAAVVARYLGF